MEITMRLNDESGAERIPGPETLFRKPPTGRIRDDRDINVVVAQTSPDRVDVARRLTAGSGAQDAFAVTHLLRRSNGHGITEPQARVDAYVACLHLDRFDDYDVWCDERHEPSHALAPGTIHINDMRHKWRADIRSPFNVVNFCLPQSALNAFADEEDISIGELNCPIGLATVDTVFSNLVMALLPALSKPEQVNRLFVDHTLRAMTAHLTRSYGSSPSQSVGARGGLASWQERRAKELLRADLSGQISLPELASACRLSSSHFSQAFKQTVGCPPHQWLLHQRVERAKELILNTTQPLSEIALATGFADQSHFTRVFSQRVKASPAAWRRAQGR
jgi:AraC family transcriptional regulator